MNEPVALARADAPGSNRLPDAQIGTDRLRRDPALKIEVDLDRKSVV